MQTWTTLEELHGDPTVAAARKREFDPAVAAEIAAIRQTHRLALDPDQAYAAAEDGLRLELPSTDRRAFLKLSGAAAVLSMAGCNWHEAPETLVPHATQPEGTTLGEARYFSTTLRLGGQPVAVMAKSYDGRPIKLEGNPDHPQTGGGALSLAGQAAILDLYDADRHQTGPSAPNGQDRDGKRLWKTVSWDLADEQAALGLKQGDIVLLTGPLDGPANLALLEDVKKAFGGRLRHVAYHPYAQDQVRAARIVAFGAAAGKDPVHHLDRCAVIVTLGSDLLGEGLATQVAYGKFRTLLSAGQKDADKGQLIAFEPVLSSTGMAADLRHRVDMEELEALAWGLAVAVKNKLGAQAPALPTGAEARAKAFADLTGTQNHPALEAQQTDPVAYAAERLVANKGKGLVYVGGPGHTGPGSLGLLLAANWLNSALGNEGATVETASAPKHAAIASVQAGVDLISDCAAGKVAGLIVWGANPVYDLSLPASEVQEALAKVGMVVGIGLRPDETTSLSHYFLPCTHDLEGWGDSEWRQGVYGLQQPLIRPLWDVRQPQETLIALAARLSPEAFAKPRPADAKPIPGVPTVVSRQPLWQAEQKNLQPWHEYLAQVWQTAVRSACGSLASPAAFWNAALARGVAQAPADAPWSAAFALLSLDGVPTARPRDPASFSLVLSASRSLGDGSQANNAFLQESPDPVAKVCWDNYCAVSLSDAHAWNLDKNQMLALTIPGQEKPIAVPVVRQPGQKAGTLELFLGWGRDAGAIANDALQQLQEQDGVGQRINAFKFAAGMQRWGITVGVATLSRYYELAETQHHNYMDGRDIALADPLPIHQQDPDGAQRSHHSLWKHGTGTVNRDALNTTLAAQDDQDPKKHPGGGRLSLWDSTHVFPGRRWGMSVDLNSCIGCNACIVACSVENNVPVVGRDQMRAGREMHWLRIDRYYSTEHKKDPANTDQWNRPDQHAIEGKAANGKPYDPEHLEVISQPLMCQQCGHAPCEEVCPAMATMRNEEGINLQIYNRCIGTRFCANNCPYKVRRFNFYEYSKYRAGPQGSRDPFDRVVRNVTAELSTSSQAELKNGGWTTPLALMWNPEVAIRSKGVMEKCNFCVQKTRKIREEEKRSGRPYDDTVPTATTACAQTCPTRALTFGDINDPHSQVNAVVEAAPHRYKVLDEMVNTRPAVQYLRLIRHRPLTIGENEVVAALSAKHAPHDPSPAAGHDHPHPHPHNHAGEAH